MHNGVDWKNAPKNAVWWAVDADGNAHWFKAPDIAPFTNFWFVEENPAPALWIRRRLAREPHQEALAMLVAVESLQLPRFPRFPELERHIFHPPYQAKFTRKEVYIEPDS
jgi:hypothetical protein